MPKSFLRLFLLTATVVGASGSGAPAQQRCLGAPPCIRISDAIYGTPGGRTCAPIARLRTVCDRRASCQVRSGNDLCGDPDPGVVKQLFVRWTCTDQDFPRFDSVREGGTLTIGCAL